MNITGLGFQQQPYVQFTDAVVSPRGERREEWWVFAKIRQAMGLKSPLDAEGDPAAAMWGRIDHMMARRGTSLDQLKARPDGLALERFAPEEPLPTGEFYARHLQTSDGRVDCCPAAFAEGALRAAREFKALEREPAGTLKLITRRTDMMMNSWFENLPKMQRRKGARNPLYIHPEDAATRGLAEGAVVKVRSAWGEAEAILSVDDGLKPGVVAMTHGAGNRGSRGLRTARETPGTNVNALLPSGAGSFDPLSNQAFMTGIPVSID